MLHKDPRRRITKGQIGRIKAHPWCSDINWQSVLEKRQVPPHIPSISKSNFDPEYVRETSIMTVDRKQSRLDSSKQDALTESRKNLVKERSKVANNIDVDASMISQHSYFYQADGLTDLNESMLEQTSIDDVNLSGIKMKP